jgi:hypothetical protein
MLLMRERPANRRLVKDGRLREGPRWAGPLLRLLRLLRLRPLRPLIGKPLRLRAGAPLLEGPLLLGSLLEGPLEGGLLGWGLLGWGLLGWGLLGWGLLGGRVLDGGRRRMGPLGWGVSRRVSAGSLCPGPAVLGPALGSPHPVLPVRSAAECAARHRRPPRPDESL